MRVAFLIKDAFFWKFKSFLAIVLSIVALHDIARAESAQANEIILKFYEVKAPRRNSEAPFTLAYQTRAIQTKAPKSAFIIMEHAITRVHRPRRVFRNNESATDRNHLKQKENIGLKNNIIVKLKPGVDPETVCYELMQTDEVAYCHPNHKVVFSALPNDTYLDPDGSDIWKTYHYFNPDRDIEYLWGLRNIHALDAWQSVKCSGGCQGQGSVVVVNDSGVDITHPDISDNIYINPNEVMNGIDDDKNGFIDDISGWNFGANNNTPVDLLGHGTFLAGEIAAIPNNNIGIAGVSPKTKIFPLASGNSSKNFAAAMIYAVDTLDYNKDGLVDMPVVINNSWSLTSGCLTNQTLIDAIKAVEERGAIVVFSAGNDSTEVACIPQNMIETIVVGGTGYFSAPLTYSNYGKLVDISAPGGGKNGYHIYSLVAKGSTYETQCATAFSCKTVGTDEYKYMGFSGTSMSAPLVAGSVANLLSRWWPQRLHYSQVRQMLSLAADPISSPIAEKPLGAGILNSHNLVELAELPQAIIPTHTPTPVSTETPPVSSTPGANPTQTPNAEEKLDKDRILKGTKDIKKIKGKSTDNPEVIQSMENLAYIIKLKSKDKEVSKVDSKIMSKTSALISKYIKTSNKLSKSKKGTKQLDLKENVKKLRLETLQILKTLASIL